MRQACVRRVCALMLVAIATGLGTGCDEGGGLTAPSAAGTISGTVTIDGTGAAGVTVAMSTGSTATTNAAGGYQFTNVAAGAYVVTISGFPADVSFPSTTQAAVLTTAGQVVLVNFAGARVQSQGTTHSGTLSFAGGDASHNTFVFNAPQPKSASLTRTSSGATQMRLTPLSGFAPSTLPELTGTVTGAGAVSLSGSGTIAGTNSVSVTATGTLINGRLDITITVGADGRLPGGQPIQYRYVDN